MFETLTLGLAAQAHQAELRRQADADRLARLARSTTPPAPNQAAQIGALLRRWLTGSQPACCPAV